MSQRSKREINSCDPVSTFFIENTDGLVFVIDTISLIMIFILLYPAKLLSNLLRLSPYTFIYVLMY